MPHPSTAKNKLSPKIAANPAQGADGRAVLHPHEPQSCHLTTTGGGFTVGGLWSQCVHTTC